MKSINDCIVLFGGNSSERLVSVASAQNISKQLEEAAFWFWSKDGAMYKVSKEELQGHRDPFIVEFRPKGTPHAPSLEGLLPQMKGKTIILALHGTEGEDGNIQKFFEDHGIDFTGSGSRASALAFDKVATKRLAQDNALPVANDLVLSRFDEDDLKQLSNLLALHQKLVLKPLSNGSSVGLFFVSTEEDLKNTFQSIKGKSLGHYLAEPFVIGREITVGVVQKDDGTVFPLPCSEVEVVQGRQFDYEGKYLGSGVREITPAKLSAEESHACQSIAVKLHQLIGCHGYTRTDMILTQKGPILLEINTLPGLSGASFIPQQLVAHGSNLRDFFLAQINLRR